MPAHDAAGPAVVGESKKHQSLKAYPNNSLPVQSQAMHRLPDLAPNTEVALYCATILGLVLVITRGFLAWHRRRISVPHRYPGTWNDAEIKILEQLRIAIGFALAATWASLIIASPQMPSSVPFGVRSAFLLIFLLLLTTVWLRLMTPSEWTKTFIGKMRFKHAVGCILALWTILLGGSLFFIAKSAFPAAQRPIHLFGTFA